MTNAQILDLFSGVSGRAQLQTENLARFAVGGLTPQIAVAPSTIDQLREVVRICDERDLAIIPWGGGSAIQTGNTPVRYDVAVLMSGLNQVIEYEPADLTVGVQAGIRLAELQRVLGEKGQFLPLDPPDEETATIGGVLATRASGPLRYAHGAPRDLMIGITVVQADGALAHAGGRVVKNVTGYDLGKLHLGALGTLGIIAEARFKVLPLPPATISRIFVTGNLAEAVRLSFALDRENLGLRALTLLNAKAAAEAGTSGPAVAVRISGEEAAVAAIARKVDARAESLGATPAPGSERDPWPAIRQLGSTRQTDGSLLLRASMLPTQVEAFCAALEAVSSAAAAISAIVPLGIVTAVWHSLPEGAAKDTAAAAFALAEQCGVQAWFETAPEEVTSTFDVWGPPPPSFPLMRRLKEQYDPRYRLNPGRYVGRL
jgi:glycolate oxidase FAD binding subunit